MNTQNEILILGVLIGSTFTIAGIIQFYFSPKNIIDLYSPLKHLLNTSVYLPHKKVIKEHKKIRRNKISSDINII